MNVQYDIGHPMTFEEMEEFKRLEAEHAKGGDARDASAPEAKAHPHLFEDKPLGTRRVALLSILAPSLPQRHGDGCTYIKIRAASNSIEDLHCLAPLVKAEGCALYAFEMFKFCCIPPLINTPMEEADDLMEDALVKWSDKLLKSRDEFNARKKEMRDDIARQEEIKSRIRAGELEESALRSACVLPEPVSDGPVVLPENDFLPSDAPLSAERYAVICAVDTVGLDTGLPENSILIKICGVFVDEAQATEHVRALKKHRRYNSFDLCVVSMYEWLKMPPPVDLVDHVVYDHPKLGEILGDRAKPVAIPERDDEDGFELVDRAAPVPDDESDGLNAGQRSCKAIMERLC